MTGARARRLAAWVLVALAALGGGLYWRTRPVVAARTVVERGPVAREATGTGTIESETQVTLAFTLAGRIARLGVREGDLVREGDELAWLDASEPELELGLAQKSVEVATAAADRSDAEVDRARAALDAALLDDQRAFALFEAQGISRAELDASRDRLSRARAELAAAQAGKRQSGSAVAVARQTVRLRARRSEDAVLESPVTGIVVRRLHEVGDVVSPGAAVLVVASTGKLWARAWMDETVLHELREGQAARVVSRGEPSRPLAGRVDRIGVEADRQTHEVLVDVELLERPPRLLLGQRADVFVTLERRDEVTRVPRAACANGERCFVDREGRVAVAEVRFGLRATDWLEVVEGLSPGEVVLVVEDQGAELAVGRRVREALP